MQLQCLHWLAMQCNVWFESVVFCEGGECHSLWSEKLRSLERSKRCALFCSRWAMPSACTWWMRNDCEHVFDCLDGFCQSKEVSGLALGRSNVMNHGKDKQKLSLNFEQVVPSAPKLFGLMICQWQKCSITLKGLRISSGGTKTATFRYGFTHYWSCRLYGMESFAVGYERMKSRGMHCIRIFRFIRCKWCKRYTSKIV